MGALFWGEGNACGVHIQFHLLLRVQMESAVNETGRICGQTQGHTQTTRQWPCDQEGECSLHWNALDSVVQCTQLACH